MAISVLNSVILADRLLDATVIASPVAGVWYWLDVAWGWATSDPAASITTALSVNGGATIDTTTRAAYHGHSAGATGRTGFDFGFAPDNKAVFLKPTECAQAFWRVQFPSAGAYIFTLSNNVGTINVTAITAPVVTSPTWTVKHPAPMNRGAAKIGTLAFNGTYPSGGLDVNAALIGLGGIIQGIINPVPPLIFTWSANKLQVFNANGEVSGAQNFSTDALFIGVGN
jgi:hypothetical protein